MDTMLLRRLDLKHIILEERIGQGNAPVYNAKMGGKTMAVKKMNCDKNEIPQEVEVQSKVPPHPNILPLLGIAHSKDGFSIYICMELADKSLHKFLHTEKKKPSLRRSSKWAMQIAKAMHHIHQHGFAHRDLKSANVLLFEKRDIVKLCDFGSARVLERTATVTGMTGTHRWMAPEFNDKATTRVNQRCDVFSYGMVLYEIFAQEIPFSNIADDVEVSSSIGKGTRPSIPPGVPAHIQLLIESCWRHKPHDRPKFEAILQVLATTPKSGEEIHDALAEKTPLHRAAESGDTDAVQQIIGSNVNINSETVNGKTALHFASEQGHVGVVQVLIKACADVTLRDKDGNTALLLAALRGHVVVVQLLLENKADVNMCNENGVSPLCAASDEGQSEVVDTLLKSGADPNLVLKADNIPLLVAAGKGNAQIVERLLDEGADINCQSQPDKTALFCASGMGHVKVVQLLLQKHADVTICDKDGASPLCAASQEGHIKVVDALLSSGANPNLATVNGVSPLYLASQNGHNDVVDTLLKSGADPNMETYRNPLLVAATRKHTKLITALLEGGANINYQDESGRTALWYAAKDGHVDVVQLLLQCHADISVRDVNRDTAMDKARSGKHDSILHLLEHYERTQ